jgi:hypothetical protein
MDLRLLTSGKLFSASRVEFLLPSFVVIFIVANGVSQENVESVRRLKAFENDVEVGADSFYSNVGGAVVVVVVVVECVESRRRRRWSNSG